MVQGEFMRCPMQGGPDSRQPPIPIEVAPPSPSENSHLQANASGGRTKRLLCRCWHCCSSRGGTLSWEARRWRARLSSPVLLPGCRRLGLIRGRLEAVVDNRTAAANAFRFINLEEGRLCGSDGKEQLRDLVKARCAFMPTEQDPGPSYPATDSAQMKANGIAQAGPDAHDVPGIYTRSVL
jgi:hypothetical protein